MRILVLGGTEFLGRAFVEAACLRGHEVTLLTRGKTNPELFPELERIHTDRSVDVSPLLGRSWDAVLDTCGYLPRVVRMSAEALKSSVETYLFISSISVFKDFGVLRQDESAPLGTADEPLGEEVTGKTYGPLKVRCEQVVHEVFPMSALIVRPGLIVGPHDPTDRFTYWPVRMAQGGDVLIPARTNQPMQIIDVRDLSSWCVDLLEQRATGVFNATGPQEPYSSGYVLDVCAAGTPANLIRVDSEFCDKSGLQTWSDLPLFLPFDGSWDGVCHIDVARAIEAGLSFRPLEETIADTRVWAESRPDGYVLKAGLKPDREQELLAEFRLGGRSGWIEGGEFS